jgi:ribose transport system substrate-binding protein
MAAMASGSGESQGTSAGDQGKSGLPLDGMKIGITPYWLDSGNLVYTTSIKNYLEERGADVSVLNPNGDAAVQRDQVNVFITAGYDAVVLCPVNPGQQIALLKKLQDANIPTVLFWNVVPEGEMEKEGLHAPVFVLNDYETYREAAKKAVEYVRKNLGEEPKVIIFDDPSNPVLHARANGFQDGLLEAAPNAEILFRDFIKFTQNDARTKMQDLLLTYPEVNIIQPSNAEAGSGAYAALRAAGRGEAVDKIAKTEYILFEGPNNARLDFFLDPSTSIIDFVLIDFVGGGIEIGKKVEEMLGNENWKEMGGRMVVPSELMAHDCETAAAQFAEQYSILDDFEPIDCSKY